MDDRDPTVADSLDLVLKAALGVKDMWEQAISTRFATSLLS
ncbi:hypothetical protein ACT8ZS_16245 [Paenibacillus sp. M.A.Huq-84]